jgi:4-amino-4-deoxy-L-arabinose transferase-like glycosyltransferase
VAWDLHSRSAVLRARRFFASPLPGVLLTLALFGAPLFINLGGLDLHNDEALYSYVVDRMIETGTWSTPKSPPDDWDFLEKPPLSFWIVAASIKSGLLPKNEIGMRAPNAAMGAVAFVYVFLLAWRLRGPAAGLIAVCFLFAFEALIFDHGLRSNNTEAALFLSYCAGFYHFARWVDDRSAGRFHAYAAAAAFFLGFMSKFVAVVCLPIVLLLLAVVAREPRAALISRWREWRWPALLVLVLSAPWFIYHTTRRGLGFWEKIFGEQVLARVTSGIDPSHLAPRDQYFRWIWEGLETTSGRIIVGAGLAWLAYEIVSRRNWRAWLVLLWAIIPMALISLSSSKLPHYMYPFLPPFAIAAGWFIAVPLAAARRAIFAAAPWPATPLDWLRQLITVVGYAALIVAIVNLAAGPIDAQIGDLHLLRSSSFERPVLTALLCFLAGFRPRSHLAFAATLCLLASVLPLPGYFARIASTHVINRPFRAMRDCFAAEAQAGRVNPQGSIVPFGEQPTHTFFYYFRHLGPYTHREQAFDEDVMTQLVNPAMYAPAIFTPLAYEAWIKRHPLPLIDGVRAQLQSVILLPGPYAACVTPAISAGAVPIWRTYVPGPRQ